MAKILLGVTGSVAAIKTPSLVAHLRSSGHRVKVIATRAALYFFDPVEVRDSKEEKNHEDEASSPILSSKGFFRDADEWPGKEEGRIYQRDDPVLHIELRRWADMLLIAPLDANTLAKLAMGLADNCLMCVWRAWDRERPVVLAPAMNTLMWKHPLTARHLRQIAADSQQVAVPSRLENDALLDWINAHSATLRIVPPISKRLACGDVGVGAMANLEDISGCVESLT